MLDIAADPAKVPALRNHRTGSAMTRAPISLLPILALAALLGACVPPPGYANPDIRADYTIGNHLFDVRAVRQTGGYDVYVAELGGPYLTDVALLDVPTHIEAAQRVIRASCPVPSVQNDWRTFGVLPAPQPSLGIIARFSCS
jgi:hypothetical protein